MEEDEDFDIDMGSDVDAEADFNEDFAKKVKGKKKRYLAKCLL
jgi:hypothetical protein